MSNEYLDWAVDKIQEEKLIVEKYPFLHIRDIDGHIDIESKFPMISLEIPDGWNKLFFQMCSDIKPILEREGLIDDFYFIQVKEKYNRLICYYNNAPKEVEDIISKYETMAQYVCVNCGKPAVFETTGYIASYCDDCINQYNRNYNYHYLKTNAGILFADEWERYVKGNNYEKSE